MDADEEKKVREVLFSWGVKSEVKDKFIDQEMDLFSLEFMDEMAFNDLLPTEGARIKLKMRREVWSLKGESKAPSSSSSIFIDVKDASKLNCPSETFKMLDVDANGNILLEGVPEIFMEGDELTLSTETKDLQPKTPVSANKTPLQEKSVNTTPPFQEPSPKRVKTYDLRTILTTQTGRKKILALFEKDKEFKKDSTRDALVDCILDVETQDDLGKNVPRERLKTFAEAIVALFPSEKEETYFEYKWNAVTKKHVAKGKLVWHVYNRRRSFVNAGAIPPKSKTSKGFEQPASKKVTVDQNTAGKICWLETNRGNKGNWDTVLPYGKDTSAARLDLLVYNAELDASELDAGSDTDANQEKSRPKKKAAAKVTRKAEVKIRQKAAFDFVNKYPALQEDTGYHLFEIDFKTLQPDVDSLAFFTEWASFSSFVSAEIQKKHPDFLDDSTLTTSENNLLILQNISKLFPVVTVSGDRKKKGKKTWRPSHAEASEAFLMYASSTLKHEELDEERRETLRKLGMQMQPFIAVVGEVDENPQYQVCINEFTYDLDSVLQAVDVTLKSFFALHLHFPPESEQIWLFIQRAVYCFTTEKDSAFNAVDTRVAEYTRFKKKLTV